MADELDQPVVGDASPDPTGVDLLRAAFDAPPPADEDTNDAATSPDQNQDDKSDGAGEGSDEGAPAQQAPQYTDEDLGRVLQDPRVVNNLRNTIAQRDAQLRAQWEQEQQAARFKEEESLLDDETLGQRVRENQRLAPLITNAQAQGYARAQQDMLRLGIGDIMEKVPEMKALTVEEKAVYDPLNPRYGSMGDYFNAVVDMAASKRAEKLAQTRAKELASAMVKDQTAKLRKDLPNIAGPSGTGRDVAKLVDVEKMSGRAILDQAFG